VPADGETMGEIMFRGNITMKGYLKNPKATQERSPAAGSIRRPRGDVPDGYVKIKDRSKDVIISGREHIFDRGRGRALSAPGGDGGRGRRDAGSEVGRDAVRVRRAEGRREASERDHRALPRAMAKFKAPRAVVFGELPKTSTGKIQKFLLREKRSLLPRSIPRRST
jgi:fatty-acyl-CoA synthase